MNTNTIALPDLGKLNELAKVHALSYASPHHFTMSVNGLREVVSALQPPAGNTIALDALKAAYSAMQHMGNVLNNIDAVDEDEDAQHDAAFEAVRAAIAELEHPKKLRVVAAPMNSYPEADQRFFDFWYGHMVEDFMQPPLVDIDHATARYIWNAAEQARAAIAALEAEPQPEADMFWDGDDPEIFGHDIQELAAERGPGQVFSVDRAMRLPSIKVRVIAGETEDDENTWEEILPTPPKD